MTHGLIKVGEPPEGMADTMLDRRLERIASSWKAKSDKGEMPDALYDAIAEGSEGAYDKKVIRNLARVSRIVDDNGEIRKFSDFKADWRYSHSTFGLTDTCTICGQSPIVENCILKDDSRAAEIVIGNRCVHRYMDIVDPTTGQNFSEEQKVDFLRGEKKEARDEYTRLQWMSEHPHILTQLKNYEAFMQSDPELKRLHTVISKRMVSHGFPGAKSRRQWSMFMATAEASLSSWEKRQVEQRHMMRVRAEQAEKKKAAFISTLKHNRLAWHKDSEEWLTVTKEIKTNKWERETRLKVARRLKNGQELSEALQRFKKEMLIRSRLDDGDVICDDEDFMLLRRMLDNKRLNGWEQAFARSIMGRIAADSKITPSQREMIDRLRARDRND